MVEGGDWKEPGPRARSLSVIVDIRGVERLVNIFKE